MTDEEKKARLLKQLADADVQAEQSEKDINDLGKSFRLIRDAAKPFISFLNLASAKEMPPGSLDSQLSTWTSWNSQAKQFSTFMNSVPMT